MPLDTESESKPADSHLKLRFSEHIWQLFSRLVSLGSGECLLNNRSNGGTVVLARAFFSALVIYLITIGAKSKLMAGSTWGFSWPEFRTIAGETIPWFGAIFAGAYAALYTRFSSQWSYLADLYNQIMAAQVQSPWSDENSKSYSAWMAGFIEDAEELHLALKPIYSAVILSMLERSSVREAYIESTAGSSERLDRLVHAVTTIHQRECNRRMRK
jgi:hypothetical protein